MKKDPYAPLRDQMSEPPTHWRSLEHKEADPEYVAQLDPEFASGLTRTSVNSNVLGGAIEPAVTETAVAKPVPEEGLE